jgi:hypothetical protein
MGIEDPLALLIFGLAPVLALALLAFGTIMIIRHWRR